MAYDVTKSDRRRIPEVAGKLWCSGHKDYLEIDNFHSSVKRIGYCIECHNIAAEKRHNKVIHKKLWKAEYNKIHKWRLRHRTKSGICSSCSKICATQWSNKPHTYIKDNDEDWQELCPRCHIRYDKKHFPYLFRISKSRRTKMKRKKRPWLPKSTDMIVVTHRSP